MALVIKTLPKLFCKNSKQKGDSNLATLDVIEICVAVYKYLIAQSTFRTLKYAIVRIFKERKKRHSETSARELRYVGFSSENVFLRLKYVF